MSRHPGITRRTLVRGAIAAPLTLTLTDWLAAAPAAPPPKRSELGTEAGKKMLALYGKAINQMKDAKKYPRYHPHNWYFQANIHDYPADENVNKIFDPAQAQSDEERARITRFRSMAIGTSTSKGIWKTCSHFGYTAHFLTWHRMHLFFFERIIEKVVQEPFALPYWGYNTRDPESRKLPSAFRPRLVGGQPNPLYLAARNQSFLESGFDTPDEIDPRDAFRTQQLLAGRSVPGFTAEIESLHNNVHAAVGTPDGMGDIVKAARDPIFWVHHTNIDRLWESWRRANPDGTSPFDSAVNGRADWVKNWKDHDKFSFVDQNGIAVVMTVADALRASNKLNVAYDRLEDLPTGLGFAPTDDEEPKTATVLSKDKVAQLGKITKQGAPVKIIAAPAVEPPVTLGFGERSDTQYTLSIDVEASGPPGAAYRVFLRVKKASDSAEKVERLIKTFNLFGAGHGSHHVATTWAMDISSLVRNKLIDPKDPVDVIVRASYADPKVPVEIKGIRIDAR